MNNSLLNSIKKRRTQYALGKSLPLSNEDVAELIREAIARYVADVQGGSFPGPEHSSDMDVETLRQALEQQ